MFENVRASTTVMKRVDPDANDQDDEDKVTIEKAISTEGSLTAPDTCIGLGVSLGWQKNNAGL